MKIGILTLFHGNNNWGGVLQGYSMKHLIEDRYPDAVADNVIDITADNENTKSEDIST